MLNLRKIKYALLFNRKEITGFIAFSTIVLVLFFTNYILPRQTQKTQIDSILFEKKIKQLKLVTKNYKPDLYTFNPNTIDSLSMLRLGFDEKQVTTFLKYRKTGAIFYKKEDFKKLYFVTDSIFLRYKPFIKIPESYSLQKKKIFSKKNKAKRNRPKTLFEFNPNTLSTKNWNRLNLPRQIVLNAQKYIAKGGKFHTKTDFKKLYGMTDSIFNEIEAYIIIPSKIKETHNLNTIDYKTLLKIGISSKTSNIFLHFRSALGGFYSKNQIKDIYNISSKEVKILWEQKLDITNIKKIDLNKVNALELAKHPYINKSLAITIIKHRKTIGQYKSLKEISSIKDMHSLTFYKIKPYLQIKK